MKPRQHVFPDNETLHDAQCWCMPLTQAIGMEHMNRVIESLIEEGAGGLDALLADPENGVTWVIYIASRPITKEELDNHARSL